MKLVLTKGLMIKVADMNGRRWLMYFLKGGTVGYTQGFVPIAKLWVVEQIISRTNFLRRIVKDYEHTTQF
jgi:hypothetical protein